MRPCIMQKAHHFCFVLPVWTVVYDRLPHVGQMGSLRTRVFRSRFRTCSFGVSGADVPGINRRLVLSTRRLYACFRKRGTVALAQFRQREFVSLAIDKPIQRQAAIAEQLTLRHSQNLILTRR